MNRLADPLPGEGLPRAVVFDMDGLLLDSERIALACFEQAARALGAPWREEVGLSLVGLNARDSDRLIATAFGADFPLEALRCDFGARYDACVAAGGIPLKPGVEELFEALRGWGIPCALATSTHRARAEAKLARAGLLPGFRASACGDEVRHGKPAPEIYELAARRLGVAPAGCLALEDSNAGIRAALAAGMRAIMVPDLLAPAPDVRAAAVPVMASLHEVRLSLAALASRR
ncbi:MAG: HAD family phosphatase [Candidatus Dactylopiibacterium sp.]|nr:HAD family phosphatase [Candidatus Dactylopiibacterium sp.]